ncbi:MAG: protein kinase [Phycisphaerae bacterium]
MFHAEAPCPTRDVLEGIALGQSAAPETQEHLARCENCRRSLDRIREDNQFLSAFAVNGGLPTAATFAAISDIQIPGYEIVREIHRGGQGVVFLARQRATNRAVAIKVMKHGPFATLADRARFEREVATLVRLEHPNIVAVHDAGTIAGFQYFVMNHIDGRPLDEAGLVHGPQSAASRGAPLLQTFVKVCDAVHAAHLRGVIHRDLKPSNVLVDQNGEPYVLDFGLARPADAERDSAMTRTGQFVGSLPWASPEQIEGVATRIDLRTDVYSLGAILFQLLTGALPFKMDSGLPAAIDDILHREPPRPSTLLPAATGESGIDDELDTIVLKCLSKDRERRYQSAGELARDLRRYLAGEAIEAKRDSAVYVLRKTLRRYRWRVAVAGAFVILSAVFAIVMAWLYRRSTLLERETLRSAITLTDLLSRGNIEQGRMAGMLGNPSQAEQLLWRELLVRREPNSDRMQVNDPPGPPEAYWALWELYRRYPCLRTLSPTPLGVRTATLAENGQSLWTVDYDGFAQRIDLAGASLDTYRIEACRPFGLPTLDRTGLLAFNRDGIRHALWRRNGARGETWFELPQPTASESETLCVSRSGRRFAALVNGAITLWDAGALTSPRHFALDKGELTAMALSNGDERLAARDRLGGLHIWDVETGRRVVADCFAGPARQSAHAAGALEFSPDDRRLADVWMATKGRIWDLGATPPSAVDLSERPGDHRTACFSPDGARLAIGDLGGVLRLFDARTGQRVATLPAHSGRIRSVFFQPDGHILWTCGDNDLRQWEVASDEGEPGQRVFRIDGDLFHSADISPDGRWLAAGGVRGVLHRVELAAGATSSIATIDATIACVAISPDGRRLAAATYADAAFIWLSDRLDQTPLRLAHPNRVSAVCFNHDGTRLATACDDGVVRVWDSQNGLLLRELRLGSDRVPQIAFGAGATRLAAVMRTGELLVWRIEDRNAEVWAKATNSPLRAVCFSPDGRWLVAAGADRTLDVYDTSTHARVAALPGHNQEIYSLDISPSGEWIASGDSGGTIRLWDAVSRKPLATLDGHGGAVMSIRFARDGGSIVSASIDGTLRIGDLTRYAPHIAGNLGAQLRRLGVEQMDARRAADWRHWAEIVGSPPIRTGNR